MLKQPLTIIMMYTLIFYRFSLAAYIVSLISNFRCVLSGVCFILGDALASEFRCWGITQKKAYNTYIVVNNILYSEKISLTFYSGVDYAATDIFLLVKNQQFLPLTLICWFTEFCCVILSCVLFHLIFVL
jgi:hypothetical protein